MDFVEQARWFTPVGDGCRPGKVTLVGAGPGAVDLLTVRAARALEQATMVLYDNLVSKDVLALVPAGAEMIYVGKVASHHTLAQESIIDLMVRLAQAGHDLVRLKGGDGYIFGRGGEEAQVLAEQDIPFEVVPGITAAQGAGACAGIPLTHRDYSATLVLATGHLRGANEVALDWQALSRPRQTVVIYMGVGTLPVICTKLVEHGLPGHTPAALVERATRPDQRTIVGTLETLPALSVKHGVHPPALILIGDTVSLQERIGGPALR